MSDTPPYRIIRPPKGWWSVNWSEIWRYRELLYFLAWRDVKVRYKQTVLGVLWAFIQPFVQIVVFSVIFGRFARMDSEGLPYPVFASAGLLPWQFFSETLNRSSTSMLQSAGLVTKVYFPRLIIPIAAAGGCLVDFAVSLSILAGLMAYYGVVPGVSAVLLVPLICLTLVAALGGGILLSALTVSYRDFRYLIPLCLQVWLYMTPVVYPARVVPAGWRELLFVNPMAGLVEGYRSALLGTPLIWSRWIAAAVSACFLFGLGVAVFQSREKAFADVI